MKFTITCDYEERQFVPRGNSTEPARTYGVVLWLSPFGVPIPIGVTDKSQVLKKMFLDYCKSQQK